MFAHPLTQFAYYVTLRVSKTAQGGHMLHSSYLKTLYLGCVLLSLLLPGCFFGSPDCRQALHTCATGFTCQPGFLGSYSCEPPSSSDIARMELHRNAMEAELKALPSARRTHVKPIPKVDLGEMTVSLKDARADRYLKVRIQLELDKEETRVEVESRLNEIKYHLQAMLSGQRVRDVQGAANKEALRNNMIRRANAALGGKGRIVEVWPSEWIVQ